MRIDELQEVITPLGRPVTVRVMVPNGYGAGNERYPVIYINDGQDVFRDDQTFWGCESLRFEQYYRDYGRFLPKAILVAVDSPDVQSVRTAQYSPYTKDFVVPEGKAFEPRIEGRGREYLEWLTGELKERIDTAYRTLSGPADTAICGYSTGALNAIYAVLAYPRVFSRILAMSPAVCIWMDRLEETMRDADYSHIARMYLDVGTNEFGRMTTADEFLAGGEKIHRIFAGKMKDASQMKYLVHPGVIHSQRELRWRFPDALRWVFLDK
jgi:Predicted hydrolase of the alpha/beta superfamily